MNGAKRFLNRWKTEYDWRTFTQSLGSFAVNVFFALYNGFLGVRHSSLWHGSICAYYLFLVLLRGGILTLQNTLIMVSSSGGDMGMLPLTAVSSAAVWLSTLGLSAAALAHGIREGTG